MYLHTLQHLKGGIKACKKGMGTPFTYFPLIPVIQASKTKLLLHFTYNLQPGNKVDFHLHQADRV